MKVQEHDFTVDGFSLTGTDSYGVEWRVKDAPGWHDGAAVRAEHLVRAQQDGEWPMTRFKGGRTVALSGSLRAPDVAAFEAAASRLSSVLAAGGSGPLVVTSTLGQFTCEVAVEDGPHVDPLTDVSGTWDLTLFAPDPLKYGPQVFGSTDLAGQAGTGLKYAPEQVVATNLFPDPAMTKGAAAWSTTGGTVANGPEGGIKVTATGTGYAIAKDTTTADQITGLAGASKLYVSVDVRVTGTTGFFVQANQMDASGTSLGNTPTMVMTAAVGTWTRCLFALSLSAGAASTGNIQLIRSSGATVGDTTEWRNLRASTVADGPFFSGSTASDGTYSYRWTGTPNASTSEKYVPGGLQYPLDYGVPAGQAPGAVVVDNAGTAPYWPRLRIDGPVSNPVVTCNETGDRIRYEGDLLAGQWLDIDCGSRQVLLNGLVSVRQRVTSSGSWLSVPPSGASLSWAADTTDPAARFSVWSFEGAWS